MGLDGFAGRASRELLATGRDRSQAHGRYRHLPHPQEMEIARPATAGLTNQQIGGQLFLSPRTVEWHLRKVFTKLNIVSRRELPKCGI
jgi:DNA-binding CsgD family transcriptional regulator